MNISKQFNKFYHGIVLKQAFEASRQIAFHGLIDTATGKVFTLHKHEDYKNIDDLKQLFKILNLDYPVDEETENGKESTVDVDSKVLSQHIEWVIKILGENEISLPYIEEEWDRLVRLANSLESKNK